MAVDVIGRDEDLRSLYAFLDRRAGTEGPIAIALEGEAGIGKSTLWSAAVDAAWERGLRVLSSRPAESERGLAYAGLGDLFDGALEDVLPSLTAPQRRALEVALLVEDAEGRPVDTRALGVAVRNALQLLAEDGLVVAIDDLQWLDASSGSALGFALRRLPDTSMLLLWTRRLDAGEQTSSIETALDSDRIDRVRVGPLSVGATHQLLRARLSRTLTRPTLLRLHETSGGNPFYALELARALDAQGAVLDPTQPLPVPARLEELVSARLDGFTGATHEALVLASAHARLTVLELGTVGIERSALEPALSENVIEFDNGVIRFTHPLLASVLYQGLSAEEKQRAHGRLAELADDALARARHLALSTPRADAELANELEQAAAAAAAQGAPIAAAELGEHAIRLTPACDRDALARRIAAAARAHAATGGIDRARTLSEELLELAAPGSERAEALALAAEVEGDYIGRAIELQREALAEPGASAVLCARLHQKLALRVRFREGMEPAEEHARAAVELAEEVGDDGLRAAALAGLALVRLNAGKAGSLRLAEEAAELAALSGEELRAETDFTLAHVLLWSGELERARRLLEDRYARWLERDERSAAYALWYLSVVELRLGRLELADAYAAESRELAAPYARPGEESPTTLFPSVLIAAHRGDLARARRFAEEMVRLAELHDTKLCGAPAVLGTVELWSGEAEAAVEWFSKAERITDPADGAEPTMSWWRAEQAEALLEVGRVDDAAVRLDAWEADGRRLRRESVLADATRCRGLVAASRGEIDDALTLLDDAVTRHEAIGDPFGHARALLALGVVRRRARQKRAAHEAIDAARVGFEEMGAARWAEKAGDELGRIGGRTRIEGLTPAERRVAALVAKGRTNAEVAASLFLAERTVASHLTRVYSKLGVRSRTELSRKLR
jgi:DNA-binding CsgD family transcriptional regulator